MIDVLGSGFDCGDDKDCDKEDLLCRFGNSPAQYIYVKAVYESDTKMRCKVPEYTKPDVLKVEVTINGESYTSDGHTYGFFDPFILDAQPRLIATDGTTEVEIKGIGFVDSGEARAQYSNANPAMTDKEADDADRNASPNGLKCDITPTSTTLAFIEEYAPAANCVTKATFRDKNTLVTGTFRQEHIRYKTPDQSVLWDPFYIDVSVTKLVNE